jgi:deoxyribonuclease IV
MRAAIADGKEPTPRATFSSPDDLVASCCIGCHMKKYPTLLQTVKMLPDYKTPYQIFISNPQGTKVDISEDDLKATKEWITETGQKVYVHSQYIINLCQPASTGWHITALKKSLVAAAAAGLKGVVVHVGKSVDMLKDEAMENMRQNIKKVLEVATPECPLLLETPAGQGTETLTKREDFLTFVQSFADNRIGICVDTCHVFATGYCPLDYLKATPDSLVKLVHFNDSQTPKGSKKDRHALVGTGHIGFGKMTEVAAYCVERGWPMVIE